MKKDINPFTPGLVVMPNGRIEVMREKEENHAPFYQRILKEEYCKVGMDAIDIDKENNLTVLMDILINDFNILPYQGCTSGDRKYSDGYLFIPPLNKLTDKQLPTIIDLYSTISSQYTMHVVIPDFSNYETTEVSLGEVYEEMLKRPSKKFY